MRESLLRDVRRGRTATTAQRALAFINEHNLVPVPQRLVVAVSGGPDSMCLVHVLNGCKGQLGLDLHVAHLDHMLRPEAAADAEYVERTAHEMGIECTVEHIDVGRGWHGASLEQAAREVRYAFLARTAARVGAERVAVGHTAGDQAETVLMHLMRGSGISGLGGMSPAYRWEPVPGQGIIVIRPLLGISREETGEYCREHGLAPRYDASNDLEVFLRNRVRRSLLPRLEEEYPGFRRTLIETAAEAREACALLDDEVRRAWGAAVEERDGVLALHSEAVLKLHPAVRNHLVRAVIRRLLGDLRDIERAHIEGVVNGLALASGKRLDLPRGLALSVQYGCCVIGPRAAVFPSFRPIAETAIAAPGKTELPGWSIEAELLAPGKNEAVVSEPGAYLAHLDADIAGDRLVVRTRRPGDRFRPLGMDGSKKLQDFMVDVHIPRSERDQVPLVCSSAGVLWLVGWRMDDRAKVRESTKRVLQLKFVKTKSQERRG